MSTSVNRALKTSRNYLLVSLFLAFFGAVYEVFSHEVYSFFMIYAFAVPLVFGALPFLLMALSRRPLPSPAVSQLYAGGLMMLSMACVLKGVLDIYGSTNRKLLLLIVSGVLMLVGAACAAAFGRPGQAAQRM